MADDQIEVVEDLHAADRLAEILDGEHLISDLAVRAEINVGIFAGRGADVLELNFLQRTLAARGLLGFGGVRGEAGDEFLEFLDFLLLLAVLFLHLPDHQLARFKPEIIVAGVKLDFAVVDIGNVGADLVEKIAVVGDDDHGVLKADEKFLEPGDRVHVEVVGRLVEKQNVRIAEQGAREEDLDLLGAVQLAHGHLMEGRIDAKSGQQGLGVALGVPAVHLGKIRLEHGGALAVRVGEVGLGIERVLLLHHLVQMGVALHDGIEDELVVIFVLILLEEGETLARIHGHGAVRRLQLAGENFEEGGLAGAVGTDDAVALARQEFDVDIFKQGLLADPVGYVVCCDHGMTAFLLRNAERSLEMSWKVA